MLNMSYYVSSNRRYGSILLLMSWLMFPVAAVSQTIITGESTAAIDTFLSQEQIPDGPYIDSLQLQFLDDKITIARLQAEQENLYHRLIPAIHISASYGVKDLLFYDPASGISSIVPRDAYRLTFGLSISDLFNTSKLTRANAELHKFLIERDIMLRRLQVKVKQIEQELKLAAELRPMLLDEISMKESIARFDSLRFYQGEIDFDVMTKSRIDLLNVRRLLLRLDAQTTRLKSTLPNRNGQ